MNEIRISLELLLGNLKEWMGEAKVDPYSAAGVTLSDVTHAVREMADPVFQDVKKGYWWTQANASPSLQQMYAFSRDRLTGSFLPME
eukprot:1416924-Amphidinium_carterae.1